MGQNRLGTSAPGYEETKRCMGLMPQAMGETNVKDGPKHRRIYLELRESLSTGTYDQGGKLPSESELVKQFGASRPTVRRALAQLESEGFVEKRMGSGTVVKNRNARKSFVFGLLIPELGMTEIFEPICQGMSQGHFGGQHELLRGLNVDPGRVQGSPGGKFMQVLYRAKGVWSFLCSDGAFCGKG